MGYAVNYNVCAVCGADMPKFLGLRGNLEYSGAPVLEAEQEHMVTNVVICRRCGFVYTNPRIDESAQNKTGRYDDPQQYQSSVCADDPLKVFNFSLGLIERYCRHKGRLLDVGCGKGEFLAAAKKRGWDIFGVEPSPNLADYAVKNYGLNIRNSDLAGAAFPSGHFDAVALNMALEHVDHPRELVLEIARILKKGGKLYIEVPNTSSMLLKLIILYYRIRGLDWSPLLSPLHYPYHSYGYNKKCLRVLLDLGGFKLEKVVIRGIGLRGFRPQASIGPLGAGAMCLLSGFFNLFNQGDVLIAVGGKK